MVVKTTVEKKEHSFCFHLTFNMEVYNFRECSGPSHILDKYLLHLYSFRQEPHTVN